MKNVLCFGDSNTYGVDIVNGGRLGRDQRWTGILQSLLGDGYYVIEEGLNGRTTVFDDPLSDGRRGIDAIPMLLQTHIPLDLVIVMLGTNDTKIHFSAYAPAIAKGARNISKTILHYDYDGMAVPKILLVSPIQVGADVLKGPFTDFNEDSYRKSLNFAVEYKKIADAFGLYFFDAATAAKPSPIDQIHLDVAGHASLAKALAGEIQRVIG